LNVIFHNTQWVVALHAHTFLLTGLAMLLFAVVYALIPMLTKLEIKSKRLVDVHFWLWMIGSVGMAYFMGMAGARGMLRRTLYDVSSPYHTNTVIAVIGGTLIALGFTAFLVNIIATLGWKNVLSLAVPERWLERKLAG
jgi:heme/copper-type cytochrome/quinol oxidase subunit 1